VIFVISLVVSLENQFLEFGERSGDFHGWDDIVEFEFGLDEIFLSVSFDKDFSGGFSGNVVTSFDGSCFVSSNVTLDCHLAVKGVMGHFEEQQSAGLATGNAQFGDVNFLVISSQIEFGFDNDGMGKEYGGGDHFSSTFVGLGTGESHLSGKQGIIVLLDAERGFFSFDDARESNTPLIAMHIHGEGCSLASS